MNKTISSVVTVVGGIVVIGGILWFALAPVEVAKLPSDSARGVEKADKVKKPKKLAGVRPAATNRSVRIVAKRAERKKLDVTAIDHWLESLPEKYRKLAKDIVDASDNDNLEELRPLAVVALECPNAEVRQRAVEALGWFGKDALQDVTRYLKDKDKEVAKAAFNAWDLGVDMVDDESERMMAVKNVMRDLKDKDSLTSAAAKLEAAEDKQKSIGAIIDIVERGTPEAADAAKEAYMFITGAAWTSASGARLKAITSTLE